MRCRNRRRGRSTRGGQLVSLVRRNAAKSAELSAARRQFAPRTTRLEGACSIVRAPEWCSDGGTAVRCRDRTALLVIVRNTTTICSMEFVGCEPQSLLEQCLPRLKCPQLLVHHQPGLLLVVVHDHHPWCSASAAIGVVGKGPRGMVDGYPMVGWCSGLHERCPECR